MMPVMSPTTEPRGSGIKLFIRGIEALEESDLNEFFATYGRIKNIITRGVNGSSKGFGFVEFAQCNSKIKTLVRQSVMINGHACWCDIAKPKTPSRVLKSPHAGAYTPPKSITDLLEEHQSICQQLEELSIKKKFLESMISFKRKEKLQKNRRHGEGFSKSSENEPAQGEFRLTSPDRYESRSPNNERSLAPPESILLSPDFHTFRSPVSASRMEGKFDSPWTKRTPTNRQLTSPSGMGFRSPLLDNIPSSRRNHLQAEFHLRTNANEFIPSNDSHKTQNYN